MRWLTFFPRIENVHLTKDVGLIAKYAMEHGYHAVLAGRFTEEDYPALHAEARGLETVDLPETNRPKPTWPWFRYLDGDFVRLLRKDAAHIDVLHLFHLSRDTIAYGVLYKKLNPKGKLYVKLDAYNEHFLYRKKYSKNVWKDRVLKRIEKSFIKRVDLLSIENKSGLELAKRTYPELSGRLVYLPNGANDVYIDTHFKRGDVEKENIFLSVGRPGSPDKNYELLLRALPLIRWEDWRMVIVGDCTPDFVLARDAFFRRHPEIRDKVEFTGAITDRKKLYDLYARSKVFFLPSLKESFGISFAEALYFGCALVGHDGMSAYADLSEEGKFGTYYISDDEYALARGLHEAAKMSSRQGFVDEVCKHAESHFSWSRIATQLIAKLNAERGAPRDSAPSVTDKHRGS